ncbi:MAG: cupin domain-containing protein [Acidobacteria bacterium]|nr:cupin domain-containing protein [Acidobacteriota bacterium]
MIRRIPKPWGEEIVFAHTERYAAKVLNIRRGESLSLQYHERKDETIYVHTGKLKVLLEVDGRTQERVLEAGDAVRFPPRTRHRMEALTDCALFEVSTPELDDVVRLEDRYGRA